MTIIQPQGKGSVSPNEPKRMLEIIEQENGKTRVNLNWSSLEIIQSCLRKSKYRLIDGFVPTGSAPALTFGTAMHKALEVWYAAPFEHRRASSAETEDLISEMLFRAKKGEGVGERINSGPDAQVAAVWAFLEAGKDLYVLPDGDKRGLENGIEILRDYFDRYLELDREFVVFKDRLGPMIERTFEFPLSGILSEPSVDIWLFGTIDLILQNTKTKEIFILDHKTTSSLGVDFFNRSHSGQFVFYVLGAREGLGVKTENFKINGIQVAKTKRDFVRIEERVTENDLAEIHAMIFESVERILTARRLERFPKTMPAPCSMWGGCEYLDVCKAKDSRTKENLLRHGNFETTKKESEK